MRITKTLPVALCAGLLTLLIIQSGCTIDSADSVIRSVGLNVSGLYNGSPLVQRNTGASIQSMNVIQDGDSLQGVDNNGVPFKGTIGAVQRGDSGGSSSATFQLKGTTTAGAEGIISGTITVTGTEAIMRGTWAEPALFSTVAGTASVASTPIPNPTPSNGVSNVVMRINTDLLVAALSRQPPAHLSSMAECWPHLTTM